MRVREQGEADREIARCKCQKTGTRKYIKNMKLSLEVDRDK